MRPESLKKLEFHHIKDILREKTFTELGANLVTKLSPLKDLTSLEIEAEKLRDFEKLVIETGTPPLDSLPTLIPLVKRTTKGGVLSEKQALVLLRYLQVAKKLTSYLAQANFPQIRAIKARIPNLSPLRRYFESLFDDRGLKPDASPELYSLKVAQNKAQERLRKRLEELLKKYARAGFLQEEIIAQREGRHVFPVKAEAKAKIPGVLHDVSASGATVFIEPLEIIQITNEIEALKRAEERERERILKEVSEKVAEYAQDFWELEETVAEVDVIQAKVAFAKQIKGSLPAFKKEGSLILKKAAHPLLLLSSREVVRNDFVFPEERPVVIISGPNMGGKTVALKTVGLLVVMAQSAIPIPASPDSELPVFEDIFVDIGDEQDISANESTFSAHVKNLKKALEIAGSGKLFLLDEIGRGTAPEEGAALAMAVLEELYERGARVLATTHYEALKAFSFSRDWILPIAVGFDEETGLPTYQLIYEVAGLSQGLLLAERLGLSAKIINKAQDYLGKGDESFKEVIGALRKQLEELSFEREALLRQKEALAKREQELKELEAKLKEDFAAKEKALVKQVEENLAALEEEFKTFLRSIEKRGFQEKKAREAFSSFIKEKAEDILPAREKEDIQLEPGAAVKIKGVGQEGKVLRLKGNLVEVQIGPFRVEVSPKELIVLSKRPEQGCKKSSFKVEAQKEAPDTLNLIGLRVEDALYELDKALDRAFLAGKTRLIIIHGLGTGRLMKAVRDYLKEHALVTSVRPGEGYQGGEAVTVVELATKEAAV
ncbi:endonuclease MutS2 [Thermodesulfatator indicus]